MLDIRLHATDKTEYTHFSVETNIIIEQTSIFLDARGPYEVVHALKS